MSVTDVREWAKSEGLEVKERGRIPQAVQERYDAEHPELGGLDDDDGPDSGYDGGVTEADFPAAAGGELGPLESGGGTAPTADRGHELDDTGEQQPRSVLGGKRSKRSFRERVWGGEGTKPARPKPAHPRMSLQGLAEDVFLDLAWSVQSLPPVEKVLYLQAPLAGKILDNTVRGTAADRVFQPIARANHQIKGFEALTAPIWVALIMARGRKDEQGNYSPETVLMFGGLRHALLSMTRVTSMNFDKLKKKSEELRTASGEIDRMIEWLFEVPEQPAQPDPAGQNGQAAMHVDPIPAASA